MYADYATPAAVNATEYTHPSFFQVDLLRHHYGKTTTGMSILTKQDTLTSLGPDCKIGRFSGDRKYGLLGRG